MIAPTLLEAILKLKYICPRIELIFDIPVFQEFKKNWKEWKWDDSCLDHSCYHFYESG